MCCKVSAAQGQHGSPGGLASRRAPGRVAHRRRRQPQEERQGPQGNPFCLPAREVRAPDRRRRKGRAQEKEEGAVQKSQEGTGISFLQTNRNGNKIIYASQNNFLTNN